MRKLIKSRSAKIGLPPGTLVHVGERKTQVIKVTAIEYDESESREEQVARPEECIPPKGRSTINMNFRFMPELNWPWAYPLVWGTMIVVAALMVAYFRRKRWL